MKHLNLAGCVVPPFREEEAESFVGDGAVIVYNRTAGSHCIDELYAIYPDGRVVGNNGEEEIEAVINPDQVDKLLATINNEYKWFTNDMYSTWHNPCGTCLTHSITVVYDGQEKTITAVDGGVDMQPEYLYTISIIRPVLPKFDSDS